MRDEQKKGDELTGESSEHKLHPTVAPAGRTDRETSTLRTATEGGKRKKKEGRQRDRGGYFLLTT